MQPTVGRIVNYVLDQGKGKGEIRPAIIVRVWNENCVQLQVFTDSDNDGLPAVLWVTSVVRSANKEPRTWDWMEYQKGQAAKTESLEKELDAVKAGSTVLACGSSMSFGAAVEALKDGKKVSRPGWNGPGQWIVLMPELKLPPHSTQEPGAKVNDRTAKHIGVDTPLDSQPYFALWTAQRKWQPGWTPSTSDALAEDWGVVE